VKKLSQFTDLVHYPLENMTIHGLVSQLGSMHNLSLDDLEIQDFFKEEESNGVQVRLN
jgi:hypothetical protein